MSKRYVLLLMLLVTALLTAMFLFSPDTPQTITDNQSTEILLEGLKGKTIIEKGGSLLSSSFFILSGIGITLFGVVPFIKNRNRI